MVVADACALDNEQDCALNSDCEWASERTCPNGAAGDLSEEHMTCQPTYSAHQSYFTAAPGSDGETALRHGHMSLFCEQAEDEAACTGLSEADAPEFVLQEAAGFVSRARQGAVPAVVLSLFVAAVSHMGQ